MFNTAPQGKQAEAVFSVKARNVCGKFDNALHWSTEPMPPRLLTNRKEVPYDTIEGGVKWHTTELKALKKGASQLIRKRLESIVPGLSVNTAPKRY